MGKEEKTGAKRSPSGAGQAAVPLEASTPAGPPSSVPEPPGPGGHGSLPQGPQAPRPVDQRLTAFITGGAYGVLGVFGIALGVFGSFLYSGTIGPVPVAAIVLILINLAALWLSGWTMNSPLGVLVPAAGWLIVVVVMSARRPEGDLVITGTMPGYVFMVGGMIAALVAVVVAMSRSPGSWLLRGVDLDSRAG